MEAAKTQTNGCRCFIYTNRWRWSWPSPSSRLPTPAPDQCCSSRVMHTHHLGTLGNADSQSGSQGGPETAFPQSTPRTLLRQWCHLRTQQKNQKPNPQSQMAPGLTGVSLYLSHTPRAGRPRAPCPALGWERPSKPQHGLCETLTASLVSQSHQAKSLRDPASRAPSAGQAACDSLCGAQGPERGRRGKQHE